MSGFVASVNGTGDRPLPLSALQRATDSLRHRGPDDEGFYRSAAFSAGFRRLKVTDPSDDARQPMSDPLGRYWIVFDGAIYNDHEIRDALRQTGSTFRTRSDTEVLLTAFITWGSDCLIRLNGAFAFLIWDARERALFGARDRFGERPLFYAEGGGRVSFASEIKGLFPLLGRVPDAHPGVVRRYLENGWLDFSAQTFFRDVQSLEPAHFLSVRNGTLQTRPYWRLEDAAAPIDTDGIGQLRALLLDSVRLRLRADVPVGASLSGGMDTGSIVCAMPQVAGRGTSAYSAKTFTAAYAEFDESAYVDELNRASGASGFQCVPSPAGLSTLQEMLRYHDEPFHSFTVYALFDVMRLARAHGVGVLLNGTGADALLAGSKRHLTTFLVDLMREGRLLAAWDAARGGRDLTRRGAGALLRTAVQSGLVRAARRRWPRAPRDDTSDSAARLHLTAGFASASAHDAVGERRYAGSDRSQLHTVLKHALEVRNLPLYLRVDDRNAMAHSIESRSPFIDHRLVELVFSLPLHLMMKGGWNKYLLREAMRGIVPESVRLRRNKFAFPTPEVQWLYGDFRPQVEDLLTSREFADRGLFEPGPLLADYRQEADFWQRTHRGMWDRRSRWFRVVSLELWQRQLREVQLTQPPATARS